MLIPPPPGNSLWATGQPYGSNATAFNATNDCYFQPFFADKEFSATIFRIRVITQSGNISAAIYNSDGSTRLVTTGAIACPAAGVADLSITSTALVPGTKYYAALSCDNTTAQFLTLAGSGSNLLPNATLVTTAHPAPSTFSPASSPNLTARIFAFVILP